jgi:hypothetical protein
MTQVIFESNQAGLLIFTPKHILNLWNKYGAKEISLDQLQTECALGSDEEENYELECLEFFICYFLYKKLCFHACI